jgi:hypothetical protein
MGARIEIEHGREGPEHDPYSVTTLRVRRNDQRLVEYRRGSLTGERVMVWLQPDGRPLTRTDRDYTPELLHVLFEKHAGVTIENAERAYRRLRERCRNCGGRATRSMCGFPGEHFEVCIGCGHIVCADFDESEVI